MRPFRGRLRMAAGPTTSPTTASFVHRSLIFNSDHTTNGRNRERYITLHLLSDFQAERLAPRHEAGSFSRQLVLTRQQTRNLIGAMLIAYNLPRRLRG